MIGNRSCLSPIFFPEDSTKIWLNWQVFWLALIFLKNLPKAPLNFPKGENLAPILLNGKSLSGKNSIQKFVPCLPFGEVGGALAYSCGYSSGI